MTNPNHLNCEKYFVFNQSSLCHVETLSESEELLFGSQSLSPKKFSNAIVSPAKNNHKEETEDEEGDQSSYDGSCHSDSELSGICELDEERYVGVNYVRSCIEVCFKANTIMYSLYRIILVVICCD